MPSTPPVDPLVGQTVAGRYKILKLLGEGGMGQVYLAEHFAIEKRVALKVLRSEYAHKGDIVTRFQQEAISASRIKHPNVLDVFDFGQLENGCFYLAMEFLEGNDLADELQRWRVLTAPRALPIAMQICRALSAAHSKGVVHRDMKPENVFLQRTGDGEEIIKIVDFGIAQLKPTNEEAQAVSTSHRRLTKTGMIFGTPEYMAPEQASGKHADLRCDVYAVGIILYELFTGAVPFTGETFLGVLTKHLNELPPSMRSVYPDLQISTELEGVVQRTLAKDPNQRFQTMNELAAALAATPEGQYAGLRGPYSQVGGVDGRASGLPPGASPTPTAQQFMAGSGSMPHPGAGAGGMTDAARAAVTIPRLDTGQAVRAETDMGAEAATRPSIKSSRGGVLVFSLLGGLLIAGGAAAFLLRGSEAPAPEPSAQAKAPDPPPPVTPEPLPAAPSTAVIKPSVEPPPPAAPASVKLEVATDPPGATLSKNGFQVCDTTPCEVTAGINETLELSGEKGPLKGKAKVLAQKDQKVTIKLTAPVAAAPKGPRMCEVEMDGLKILRPCPQ
ncbi:MAG TPA: serine/threonine-protein kinase [Polyangiaceae bacterium]|nr:serine/threonine-protein kinase [Polyangiaceae bacterium]